MLAIMSGPVASSPLPPVQFAIQDVDGAYNISWSVVSVATIYRVQRKQDSGEWGNLTTTGSTLISDDQSELSSGSTYTYRVRAEGSGFVTDWSNERSVFYEV